MHKKRCARFFIALLSLTLVTNGILSNSIIQADSKQAEEAYEIYPIPHEVNYADGSFIIHNQVNVVAEDGIDEATRNKLIEVLNEKGISAVFSDKVAADTTNILLGIHGSNGVVDASVEDEDVALFDKITPYYMNVMNNSITILGGDSDAVFYGLVTLNRILQQLDGKTIRNLAVEDYADTKTRGFIEGYYGIPWTNEDRMSLMRFGGELKMTSYIFAPKDDPYHSARWREKYPDDKLKGIAEMAAVGNASKCRFVWTIHPFMNGGITAASYDRDIKLIIDKFEQLYNAGVRQFGVLGDDAGSLPRSVVIRVMEDLQAWVDSKGDVYNMVFCPGGYNNAWWSAGELDDYDAGFDEDIQIFWTGNSVCAPIIQNTLDNFRTRALPAGKEKRRAPLFWLNWPVNDINMSRLMMGKGSLLHTDINIEDLSGVVTNPMQDAEPSKVAIFAIADYAWNVKAFDEDQSWEDSFKYIDEDASTSLHTLAKHMSDPAPNGHGLVLEESPDMQPLFDAFNKAFDSGNVLTESANALLHEYEVIMQACDEFQALSQNERMKEQVGVFANALRDLSEASMEYIKTAIALENNDINAVWSHYSQAQALMERGKTYQHKTLNGSQSALPGSKRLRPFAEKMSEKLAGPVGSIVDETKVIVTPITSRTDSPSSPITNIVDGDQSSYAQWKSPNSAKAGDYIGVTFSREIELKDIEFLMSDSATSNKNTFKTVKLQYSEDGKTWTDINDETFGIKALSVKAEGLSLKVRGVRVVATEDTPDIWLACREVIYNKDDQTQEGIKPILFKSANMQYYAGSDASILDYDDATFGWFKPNGATGDYVGVDLQRVVAIDRIRFVMGSGGDYWQDYDLEYSEDGVNYTKLSSYTQNTGQKIVDERVSDRDIKARYVRLKNNKNTEMWTKICGINVYAKAEKESVYTNSDALQAIPVVMQNAHSWIEPTQDVTLENGEYIGVALSRIREIDRIDVNAVEGLTLQVSENAIIWNEVSNPSDVETARYVRYINNTAAAITFDIEVFGVYSNEVEPISVSDTTFGDKGSHLKVFDNDRTTEAIFQNSQLKGQFITYDLGQTIALDSLKIVAHDGTTDYPRHAKISVSNDLENWEDIMLLGNQDSDNPGEVDNADNINDILPDHEISYNTKSIRDIHRDVRYIKFEITRDKAGADKWVRFREFEINDGQYIPSENNPTIISTAPIQKGYELSNMIDGDVSTVYKPSEDNDGEFVYKLSEKTNFNKLSIFQSPTDISNATVSVLALSDAKASQPQWIEVGTLRASINEFNVAAYENVLAVKIAWQQSSLPVIHEITTLNVEGIATADKTALIAALEKADGLNTNAWTNASVDVLNTALENAEYLVDNEYATQAMVDSFTFALENAMDTYKIKGDMEAYRSAIDALMQGVKTQDNYVPRTWKVYREKMNAALSALDNTELSDEELQGYADALETAIAQLVYEVTSMEDLTLLYERTLVVNRDHYTMNSVAQLDVAMQKTQVIIVADQETRQDPVAVKAAMAQLDESVQSLVSTVELQAAIASASDLREEDFTAESYQVLKDALAVAEDALIDGTKDSVATCTQTIRDAIQNLVAVGEKNVYKTIVSNAIAKADVLISQGALNNVHKDIRVQFEEALKVAVATYANPEATNEALMDAWMSLANAMHYLDFTADKTALTELYDLYSALDLTQYVDDENMVEFKAALEEAISVLESETALDERIQKAYDRLLSAKEHLVLKADVLDTNVIDYMLKASKEAMNQKDYYDTSAESWAIFETALTAAQVARDEMASQAALDEAARVLSDAYVDIRLIANEEVLKDLVDLTAKINQLDAAQYSAETYAFFMEARTLTQAMIDAQRFTATQYSDYLNVKAEVERRIVEDVIKAETPSTPGDDVEDITPPANAETPQAPSDDADAAPQAPQTPNAPQTTPSAPQKANGIAKTGDATQMGLWAIGLLGAGMALQVLRKRKD